MKSVTAAPPMMAHADSASAEDASIIGASKRSPAPRGSPISFRNIVKRYAALTAVDDLTLDIAAGEFVSFLGPSGSGKTTTLLIVAGFVAPDRGSITLAGDDITRRPPYRRNIGMVYQNYALFPHMSVARNIAFPLRMRGVSRADIARLVARALALVRLEGLDERLPNQLSGGQQQRVALARALVFEPPLLLMDEPLGALDKKLREELCVEIKRIQREIRSTVIYVTHDQQEAMTMSDRIVVMRGGRVEQVGNPGELYERPRTRFVADFLGASNFLEAKVVATGEPALLCTSRGLPLRVHGVARAAGNTATVAIRPERVRIDANRSDGDGWHGARVIDSAYCGETQRFQVALDGGDMLAVVRPNVGEALIAPGTRVGVAWTAADAWVIPETGAP